jgi:hypothetical protein
LVNPPQYLGEGDVSRFNMGRGLRIRPKETTFEEPPNATTPIKDPSDR